MITRRRSTHSRRRFQPPCEKCSCSCALPLCCWRRALDRGPGGGLLDYETRLQRFDVRVNPITGRISHFRILQTVKLQDRNGRLTEPTASVPNPLALNGWNPLLLNGNAGILGRSFDPEGLVVDPRTGHFLIADEYGPSLYEFSRSGRLIGEFGVPANLVSTIRPRRSTTSPFATVGFSGSGRQDNRGYEGLAISPDGKRLFAVLQDPLLDEGPRGSGTPATHRQRRPRRPQRPHRRLRQRPVEPDVSPERRAVRLPARAAGRDPRPHPCGGCGDARPPAAIRAAGPQHRPVGDRRAQRPRSSWCSSATTAVSVSTIRPDAARRAARSRRSVWSAASASTRSTSTGATDVVRPVPA